jgi:hypothetical protein
MLSLFYMENTTSYNTLSVALPMAAQHAGMSCLYIVSFSHVRLIITPPDRKISDDNVNNDHLIVQASL